MATGACYWSGNGTYCCPCLGRGQSDESEYSSTCCPECGHPISYHFRLRRKLFLLSVKNIFNALLAHPSDPTASQVLHPRHQTVRKLSKLLHEERVVLARGTPSSGKSFLAKSLDIFLRGQGVKSIYMARFPPRLEGGPTVLQSLVEACNMCGFVAFTHDIIRHKFVFLIDDAHTTYNNSELWLLLHSVNQDRLKGIPGASFCIFSAFGTPDRGVMPHNMGSDLLVFNKSQRLFLSDRFTKEITLFYTPKEFDLYVKMHRQGRGSDYKICEVLKHWIYGLTEGQPELMDAFMHLCDMWYEAWYKKYGVDFMSFDDYEISQFFQVRGMLEATIAASVDFIGLPLSPETFFPPEQEFEVLRQAHHTAAQGLLFDPQSEAMLSCLTKGWLHMEEAREGGFKCYFPTTFHDRLVEYLIGVQELRYPTPPSLNRTELELMMKMQNMTISRGRKKMDGELVGRLFDSRLNHTRSLQVVRGLLNLIL
ncbi:uncharacterized protein N7500_001479 [Penicillium coprophilum]|uniref:uncharacterized protein n=1 Tax=Penicillium coprophilum TaxID=36646 RepID=UPI002397D815|nr:uncharacterized protein N7500_001479 [Penicillium coprophilum]KAJ5173548.1 hypothetical protein N7500_001479 [Penicillium coprophilum]